MKNPFPTNPSPGDIFLAGPVRISQIHGERSPRIWTLEQCRYAAHAINQHDKLVELAKLCYDVIEDDLEERPARHSLGNLSARLRAILKEEKP